LLTIIASMERELSGLRRGISSGQSGNLLPPGPLTQHGHFLDLRVVGAGKSQSQAGLQEILKAGSDGPPRELLMLGFAGAVDRELKTGGLVLSSRYYLDTHDEDVLVPDSAMRQNAIIAAANAGLPVTHLDSLTVDAIIATPAAKVALAKDYPVGIVEMEDYWLAAVARDAGVPFISARVVLDTAQQYLPSYLLGLSQGHALDVLRTVAMPWRVPALFGLAYQARIARQALSQFAFSFIRQWEKENHALKAANVAGAVGR